MPDVRELVRMLRAGAGEAAVSRAERVRIVAGAYVTADLAPFSPPCQLAVRLGFELRPLLQGECVPAQTSRRRIYYQWDEDPRVYGGNLYRALAGLMLDDRRVTSGDVAMVAVELAAPESAVARLTLGELLAAQRFAPQQWLEARMIGLRGSGQYPRLPVG